jgi:hypothetical protein
MSTRLPLTTLCAVLLVFAACERSPQPTADESAVAEAAPISGRYEVEGTTLDTETGRKREISGIVNLFDEGDTYSANFHLTTVVVGADGVLPADVIGQGSGTIDGRTLTGSAETQLVISTVPGVDPAFAYIPRTTTTRLVSKSVTTVAPDGSLLISIENTGAVGEIYTPTRTILRGTRTEAAPVAEGGAPDLAEVPAKAGD